MTPDDLWYGTAGPHDAKIVYVAESWGSEEARQRRPLVGQSGEELTRILNTAGINRNEILLTNVVAEQPERNEMFRFFTPKTLWGNKPRIRGLAPTSKVNAELSRLYQQIASSPRSLIITAGNWALWAFSPKTKASILTESNGRPIPEDLRTWAPSGVQTWRGSMLWADPITELNPDACGAFSGCTPLLPTIHPAAILRQWELRDVTIHDLKTRPPLALRGEWNEPARCIVAPPSYSYAHGWLSRTIEILDDAPLFLSCDIETIFQSTIVCLGFADSPHSAISIPFVKRTDDATGIESFWSLDEEKVLLPLIVRLLTHPNLRLIGQNFIYDTQHIQNELGVSPVCTHDTMIAQNTLFPGTPKALWYLASLYADHYSYWKDEGKEWDWRHSSLEQLLEYNCRDAMYTYEVAMNQRKLVEHLGLEQQLSFKHYVHGLCLRMMNRGVKIDTERRGRLTSDFHDYIAMVQRELLQIIPQEWIKLRKRNSDPYWFDSPQQTAKLFYEILGFRMVLQKKTHRPTTGKEALDKLRIWYPEFAGLFARLDALGSIENSVDVMNKPIEHDGRIRCSYNPAATETLRLSSSKNAFGRGTNLQNLTVGEED